MTRIEETRKVSALAGMVIHYIFEAHDAVESYQRSGDESDKDLRAREFYAALRGIENETELLTEAMYDHGNLFAAVNQTPIELWQPPLSSVHEAIRDAGMSIGHIGLTLLQAAYPEFRPGVEYLTKPLCREDDFLAYRDVAVESFLSTFPTRDQLNRASAMRNQELARVLNTLQPAGTPRGPVTPSPAERDLIEAIREIGPDGTRSQTAIFNALSAKGKVPSEGQTKNLLASMVRHGILLRGYRLPEWGAG